MIELLIAAVVGGAIMRAGRRYVDKLPDDSKFKGPGVIIFGGGGPKPTK